MLILPCLILIAEYVNRNKTPVRTTFRTELLSNTTSLNCTTSLNSTISRLKPPHTGSFTEHSPRPWRSGGSRGDHAIAAGPALPSTQQVITALGYTLINRASSAGQLRQYSIDLRRIHRHGFDSCIVESNGIWGEEV